MMRRFFVWARCFLLGHRLCNVKESRSSYAVMLYAGPNCYCVDCLSPWTYGMIDRERTLEPSAPGG